jgi:hypothetical protein
LGDEFDQVAVERGGQQAGEKVFWGRRLQSAGWARISAVPEANYFAGLFGGASSQFSTVSPGTRENSLLLAVSKMDSVARACAAISMSFGPMGVPACSG